jgi:DnaJ family protein A protein 2
MSDLYERLGVGREASKEEIRRAYKELAKEKHPDKGGSEEEFKQIQEAHEVLADEERRRMYDMTGSTQEGGPGMGGMGGMGGMAAGGIPFHFVNGAGPFGMPGVSFDMGDMFAGMFGGVPGGRGPRRRAPRGPDKHHDIGLTLADFYKGKAIKVKFNQTRKCVACKGSGAETTEPCGACKGQGTRVMVRQLGPMMAQTTVACDACEGSGKRVMRTCGSCHGKKFYEKEKQLDILIKPGMRDGEKMVFAGECSDSADFDAPGDVVFTLRRIDQGISETDEFEWSGDDLTVRKKVSFSESVLGFSFALENHPGGPRKVEWRGGPLLHGATLQLASGGMPTQSGARGILFVQIFVSPPPTVPWSPEDAAKLLSVLGGTASTLGSDAEPLTIHNAEPKLDA